MSKKKYKDRGWLYEKHVEQGLTNVEIADICGVSDGTICRWKDKLNIPSNGYDTPERVKDKISESVSEHLEENGHPFEGESGDNNHFYGESR